jgi:hypothetical protein
MLGHNGFRRASNSAPGFRIISWHFYLLACISG